MQHFLRMIFFSFIFCYAIAALTASATAATTEIHLARYANDKVSVINETTVRYQWMETHLPVFGDGIVHYYHQGPVFVDDPDEGQEQLLRLNSAEDTNVQLKDMGAVKGTNLEDLCNLVGGMSPGDTVKVKASDGFSRTFAYDNVYQPSARQGTMVITWFREDEGYVPEYRTGMRLVFFADNSTNPWGIHAFGNDDWHESAAPEYLYYYQQGDEKYPTTTGLSVQDVSEVIISSREVISENDHTPAVTPVQKSPASPLTLIVAFSFFGLCLEKRRQRYGNDTIRLIISRKDH